MPDAEELSEDISPDALTDLDIGWEMVEDIYAGLIMTGTFDNDTILSAIESEEDIELTTSTYQNTTIYHDEGESMSIAFISDDILVMGMAQSVKDVIAVESGDQSSVQGDILDIYDDMDDSLFKLATVIPPEMFSEMAEEAAQDEETMMSMDMDAFADLETIAVAIDKQGETLSIFAELCFAEVESAEEVQGLFGLLSMMMGMSQLEMNVEGTCAVIDIDITMAEIEEMFKDVTENLFGDFEMEMDDSIFDFGFED